ncbi:uncharacterized protein LOC143298612 [Babylonia areolata]|uniref:uncharacterized protein LOC143298612 n=1 Tax=Babylonia areolata TaxID=304850 RepID=UPI003FD43B08
MDGHGPVMSRTLATLLLTMVISDVTAAVEATASSSSSSVTWGVITQQTVTSALKNTSRARGGLGCVSECQQMMGCGSAAFDSPANVCYLQPTHRHFTEGDAGPPLSVFVINSAGECTAADAPVTANGHVSTWRLTSSSLQGDVSCDQTYMLSADVTPQVVCQPVIGRWAVLTAASCNKYSWRNYTPKRLSEGGQYFLPRAAHVGWCLRLRGTPMADTLFWLVLKTASGDIPLQVDVYFKYKMWRMAALMNSRLHGIWSVSGVILSHPFPPFPFATGVPFEVVITATSPYLFEVHVDGKIYGALPSLINVQDVTEFFFDGHVRIEFLDLWC